MMVRAAFRALDPVAPRLATRWAIRLWCTPPHPRRRVRQEAPPGAHFRVPLPGNHGQPVVAVEAWGDPAAPVTYLLHGWGGWRGQLAGMVAPLLEAGQRVVALDAPGHGGSGPGRLGGRRTTLVEIADALAAVARVAGPPAAIVAHSGAATAVALAIQDGLAAGRLVFLAPMANALSYFDPFGQALGLGPRTRSRLLPALAALVDRELADFDLPGWARRHGPLPPLLVVHDRRDKEVAYRQGEALAAAWPGATLHSTDGLGHRRIVADPTVVAATVAFVTEHPRAATVALVTDQPDQVASGGEEGERHSQRGVRGARPPVAGDQLQV